MATIPEQVLGQLGRSGSQGATITDRCCRQFFPRISRRCLASLTLSTALFLLNGCWADHSTLLVTTSIAGTDEENLYTVGRRSEVYENEYAEVGTGGFVQHLENGRWNTVCQWEGQFMRPAGLWVGAEGEAVAVAGDVLGGNGHVAILSNGKWHGENLPGHPLTGGVWGTSLNDIFAVGDESILHYDGATWTPMQLPVLHPEIITAESTKLKSVWGTASDNVYVVGTHGTIIHYDGVSWTEVRVVSNPTSELRDIWGTGPDDIYAVGDIYPDYADSTSGVYCILHFDGTEWTPQFPEIDQDYVLLSIHGAAKDNIYVVGSAASVTADGLYAAERTVAVLHFDGSDWTPSAPPSIDSATDLWASEKGGYFLLNPDGPKRFE
jgi:hypothetical protein